MRKRAALFSMTAWAALIALPALASAQAGGLGAPIAPQSGSTQRYCDEEKQLAERWLLWAAHKRHECLTESAEQDAQQACLSKRRQELKEYEKEYAEIYSQQVRNLRQDHPVVVTMLQRLHAHQELADTVLRQDVEPELLANQHRDACLAKAQGASGSAQRRR